MNKKCLKCNYVRTENEVAPDYECPSCGAIYAKVEAAMGVSVGKTMIPPKSEETKTEPLDDLEKLNEAEQYYLKAEFILHELQANNQVYGSNAGVFTGGTPANIDLAFQYIDRSIELFPDNAVYLNLKALFLSEGKRDIESATKLFEKAAKLKPRDIDIQNNLAAIKKSSSCFIATAVFGSPWEKEVDIFRTWRDESLRKTHHGKLFIKFYYSISPPIANYIAKHKLPKYLTRLILKCIIRIIGKNA